jgi:hypothetical protein
VKAKDAAEILNADRLIEHLQALRIETLEGWLQPNNLETLT